VLEDNEADDDPSPDAPLVESSVAIVNDLGVKEHSGVPSVEQPQDQADTEGAKDYYPTAIVDAPDTELHGVPVVEDMSVPECATQDEHDVTCEIQLEYLGAPSHEHTEAVNAPNGTYCAMTITCILLMNPRTTCCSSQ
jgi:hypothetical protein